MLQLEAPRPAFLVHVVRLPAMAPAVAPAQAPQSLAPPSMCRVEATVSVHSRTAWQTSSESKDDSGSDLTAVRCLFIVSSIRALLLRGI